MSNAALWNEYIETHSLTVKREIMSNYTKLVHYVIHNSKFVNLGYVDEQDFFQFGVEGLSEAIDRFDPNYGTKFETYAIQRIRGKIIDELRKLQIRPRSAKPENNPNFSNISLTTPLNQEEGYMLYEVIPADTKEPDEDIQKDEVKKILGKAIRKLNERDRLLITLYYFENLNFKEIAYNLNITPSRVSQLHAKILDGLKGKLRTELE